MSKINCLPDRRFLDIKASETVLDALIASGIEHTNICGGNAYCYTCRVVVLDGIENCSPPTSAERVLIKKLDIPLHVRLSCQTKISGDITIRRLIVDSEEDTDIIKTQSMLSTISKNKPIALMSISVQGETNFDEINFHYDILYIMSRYFSRIQKLVNRYGGSVSSFMGTKIMATFGIDEPDRCVEKAVWAGLDIIKAIDELNTFLEQLSYKPLQLSIGIHYGLAVLVPVDPSRPELSSPLGENVDLVNRAEAANREFGSKLLVTEAAYKKIKNEAEINQTQTISLEGDSTNASAKSVNIPASLPASLIVYEVTKMNGSQPIKSTEGEPKNKLFAFIQKYSN